MKPVDRQVIFIGMIALLGLMAAQCASLETPGKPAEVTPVELNYMSFFYDDTSSDDIEQALIDQFEATHPHISISYSNVFAFDRPPTQYLTDSTPPDIMAVAVNYDVFSAIEQGLILDISDIWLQSDLGHTYPARFRAMGERGGKQYFLPAAHSWTAVYYNKQIFDQYNLEPPHTWDEFLAVSDTLLANNITPVALGWYNFIGATYWFDYLNIRLNGPDFHTKLVRGQVQYDDPRIRRVFETWKFLFDYEYFPEKATSTSLLESLRHVAEGEAAMVLCSSTDVGGLPEKFQETLDFFPFPIIDPDVPVGEIAFTLGYIIPVGVSHPAETVELLTYLVSVEGQTTLAQQFAQNTGVLPVNRGIDATNVAPKVRQGLALIRDADHIGQPYISSFAPEGGLGGSAYLAFSKFLRDTENLDSALDALETARQKAFEE